MKPINTDFDLGQWREVRVGLVDSGVGSDLLASSNILIERAFFHGGRGAWKDPTRLPGHGQMVAGVVLEAVPRAKLVVANIFGGQATATVQVVTAALTWLADLNLDLVNLSFGTVIYSEGLEVACRRMASFGTLLICSTPAQGGRVFPAAFDCCIAATGDARCMPGEVSWLGTESADFGTHSFITPGDPAAGGGASFAAARLTGIAASLIAKGVPREAVIDTLKTNCRFVGPERRARDHG